MTDDAARATSSLIGSVFSIAFFIGMVNVVRTVVQYFDFSDNTINLCAVAIVLFSNASIFIMKKISYEMLKGEKPEKEIKKFKYLYRQNVFINSHPSDFIFTTKNVKDMEKSK